MEKNAKSHFKSGLGLTAVLNQKTWTFTLFCSFKGTERSKRKVELLLLTYFAFLWQQFTQLFKFAWSEPEPVPVTNVLHHFCHWPAGGDKQQHKGTVLWYSIPHPQTLWVLKLWQPSKLHLVFIYFKVAWEIHWRHQNSGLRWVIHHSAYRGWLLFLLFVHAIGSTEVRAK